MRLIPYLILFFLAIGLKANAESQKLYLYLKPEVKQTDFDPYAYFAPEAIERRIKHQLPLYDFHDLPIDPVYYHQVEAAADSVKMYSRWLNMMVVYGTADAFESFPFIESIKIPAQREKIFMQAKEEAPDKDKQDSIKNYLQPFKLLVAQTERMQGSHFYLNNKRGKDIKIAIFDAGFRGTDRNEHLSHLFENGQIEKTYDFVGDGENVFRSSSHGTSVLGCIAGIYQESHPIGLATEARFYLARTENIWKEDKSEEENWLAAAEWADKNGVQIINSSLGYGDQIYQLSEMDGQTAIIAQAARFATRKGILVVNSAGNEGTDRWRYISAPADVDSVLTVGGMNIFNDHTTAFSSLGPNMLSEKKPNVTAPGVVFTTGSGISNMTIVMGTSFSSPLVAGFAACVWEQYPEMTNMEVFESIEKSAHLYPYFDFRHGHGVPQATYFDEFTSKSVSPTFQVDKIKERSVEVSLNKSVLPEERSQKDLLLFYHITAENGNVAYYSVLKIPSKNNNVTLPFSRMIENGILPKDGFHIKIHFEGYTQQKALNPQNSKQ